MERSCERERETEKRKLLNCCYCIAKNTLPHNRAPNAGSKRDTAVTCDCSVPPDIGPDSAFTTQ